MCVNFVQSGTQTQILKYALLEKERHLENTQEEMCVDLCVLQSVC